MEGGSIGDGVQEGGGNAGNIAEGNKKPAYKGARSRVGGGHIGGCTRGRSKIKASQRQRKGWEWRVLEMEMVES